eukprot:TRINITY_DN8316_c0_g1_i10.p2 TRINITY_DN8316_c0_g1~~TRINITY_DN8316_c0_g1_i10.p2  ORF type:complete len:107 (-),score=6.76 TRINITY_DN8316_c0_g1_i10:365-685(-)
MPHGIFGMDFHCISYLPHSYMHSYVRGGHLRASLRDAKSKVDMPHGIFGMDFHCISYLPHSYIWGSHLRACPREMPNLRWTCHMEFLAWIFTPLAMPKMRHIQDPG